MFGYIKPYKPECKLREYEYYRGVYCGLCRALGKCGGYAAKLTLNYDFTFLALVRMAIVGDTPTFVKRRCLAHPFRTHPEAVSHDTLVFCAGASLLLMHGKILDDIADERGLRRLRARLLRPLTSGMCRKTGKALRALDVSITERLYALSVLEKDPPCSVDRPASLFGGLMGDILSFGLEGDRKTIAKTVGDALGRWVYLIDALDDRKKDAEKNRYNPINLVYTPGELPEDAAKELETSLLSLLADAERALDLIDIPNGDMRALIDNHLHLGMTRTIREILSNKGEKSHE